MRDENVLHNTIEAFQEIDNKELLNDIMGMEAKASIIFSEMRSKAITDNRDSVLNYFKDLNFLLNQYQNKYTYLNFK
ncbi:MAG: hypothetical protein KJ571_01435 [Bacteroidetes bacterium]|nr:hypothetical protein [Bacteroidota bacterium]